MTANLLEPHLWAALVMALIAVGSLIYAYWRYYRGAE